MTYEEKLVCISILLVILSSILTVSAQKTWDSDYQRGTTPLFSWEAYAYVEAWYVHLVGYFYFVHSGWGRATLEYSFDVYGWPGNGNFDQQGGYTVTRVFVRGLYVGNAYAGIGIYTGP